ncbi:hypothetical protein GCM10010399_87900 [Dactylosporangium fulvum]|uniref:Uncharacterized protein n=1 Tax=Dactylosporangium fulvum TaxID=53359 RepID=A0ABY5VMQ2_9ACTN|nr:hypothetical protein [Dactylosporangium fulvum]UWP78908.1 hypothetical protein Dfulv_27470 [Dactylosporangium fulvum]
MRGDDELMHRIGNLLLDAAPPDFRRIDVLVHETVAVQDLVLTVHLRDGSTPAVLPPDGLTAAFTELRGAVATPERGTWFSVRCVIDAPSRIELTYVLDHEPPWQLPVPPDAYAKDLAAFPRDDRHIPAWLRERLGGEPAPGGRDRPRRTLTAEEEHRALGSATTLLLQHLPADWAELTVDLACTGHHAEHRAGLTTIFGGTPDWRPPAGFLRMLHELRAGMHAPGRGTWHSMRFHLAHPNVSTATFNREAMPAWTTPPTDRDYADELALFPREPSAVPHWFPAGRSAA